MNIPTELIIKIFKYVPPQRCYRCNTKILPIQTSHIYLKRIFCSINCINYYH